MTSPHAFHLEVAQNRHFKGPRLQSMCYLLNPRCAYMFQYLVQRSDLYPDRPDGGVMTKECFRGIGVLQMPHCNAEEEADVLRDICSIRDPDRPKMRQ